jgi:hypothetical protein
MSFYYCKECKSPVKISKDGKFIKSCNHKSPIIAEMRAIAKGLGKAQ